MNDAIEELFLKLAKGASAGREAALRRLRLLQKAIVDREEQGETLSRLLPGGLAEKLRDDRDAIGRTERLTVTVLMSRRPWLLGHRRAHRPHGARRASCNTHRSRDERARSSTRAARSCSTSATR